ncbi:MAG: hypothetical protein ABJF88_11560 [Rhodothermales bacterium]
MPARLLVIAALALTLAACDASPGDSGICLIDATDEGRFRGRVVAPSYGDTLRLGQPFAFRAEIDADSNVTEIGALLLTSARDSLGRPDLDTLFSRRLTTETGRYTLERTVVIDTLSSPLPTDGRLVSLGVYGVARFGDCGGAESRSATFVGVVVE